MNKIYIFSQSRPQLMDVSFMCCLKLNIYSYVCVYV